MQSGARLSNPKWRPRWQRSVLALVPLSILIAEPLALAAPPASQRCDIAGALVDLGKRLPLSRRKAVADTLQESAEGSLQQVATVGGQAVRISVQAFGETGRAASEIFFAQNGLRVVVRRLTQYPAPHVVPGGRADTVVTTTSALFCGDVAVGQMDERTARDLLATAKRLVSIP